MAVRALATDYDGTLATHGAVDSATVTALQRFRQSGRKLLLVTGRQVDDLQQVFPLLHLFDRIVAENGAVLYDAASSRETLLAEPPSSTLLAQLRELGIPFSAGRVVVATVEPHDAAVARLIAQHGLKLQISYNKGSVMVLPAGVNKASGLRHALAQLSLSPNVVVGIGDAENDRDFLAGCGFGVAVANALPALKSGADLVTRGAHGAGVAEIIDRILAGDAALTGARRLASP
jgi:hydroxymethylpyrimidine pyrophosphatase-like HAD family hydrolase